MLLHKHFPDTCLWNSIITHMTLHQQKQVPLCPYPYSTQLNDPWTLLFWVDKKSRITITRASTHQNQESFFLCVTAQSVSLFLRHNSTPHSIYIYIHIYVCVSLLSPLLSLLLLSLTCDQHHHLSPSNGANKKQKNKNKKKKELKEKKTKAARPSQQTPSLSLCL